MNLAIDNLTFGWHDTPLLRNFSGRVSAGEMVLLQGDNGSGKTTLLKLMSGMIPHFSRGRILSGDILLNGDSIVRQAPQHFFPEIAYFPSRNIDFFLLNNSIDEDIALIRGFIRLEESAVRQMKETLTRFFPDLPDLWIFPYSRMTVSQKLRALVIIYSLQGATLFLLDEVFKQVPAEEKSAWLEWFEFLKSSGAVIIVSSHEAAGPETGIWTIDNGELRV